MIAAETLIEARLREAEDTFLGWLRDKEETKSALNEHAIVAITDDHGRLLYVNDNFCVISRYSKEELVGRDQRLINPDVYSIEFLRNLWQTISGSNVWRGELKNITKDGAVYWVTATIVPKRGMDGRPEQYVVIQSDITEQKHIESELAESLRLQQLLAELSSRFVAAASSQVDTTIEDTQRLIGEALNLDRSTLWQLGEDGNGMILTHSWQRAGLDPLPPTFSSVGQLPWAFAKIMRGEWFSFSNVDRLPLAAAGDAELLRSFGLKSKIVFPLVANGHTYGALAFATLREERIWRQDEIIELRLVAQIISNVLRRQQAENREEQLREELAHAMRVASLGELAAALTHELNQPLTAILSNAQAALRFAEDDNLSADELRTILRDIVRDDKRAGNVIHNLRSMVSKRTGERELCALNEIIHEVMELLRSELMTEQIDLRASLAPNLPAVTAVRVEMQQILVNLLVNAIHAMKETPEERRYIEIASIATCSAVTVRVRDHGHGIHPARLNNVFDPFFSTKTNGLGMGLSICRRIIETHQGSIEAHNHPEGGACFSFTLPTPTAGEAV